MSCFLLPSVLFLCSLCWLGGGFPGNWWNLFRVFTRVFLKEVVVEQVDCFKKVQSPILVSMNKSTECSARSIKQRKGSFASVWAGKTSTHIDNLGPPAFRCRSHYTTRSPPAECRTSWPLQSCRANSHCQSNPHCLRLSILLWVCVCVCVCLSLSLSISPSFSVSLYLSPLPYPHPSLSPSLSPSSLYLILTTLGCSSTHFPLVSIFSVSAWNSLIFLLTPFFSSPGVKLLQNHQVFLHQHELFRISIDQRFTTRHLKTIVWLSS